MPIRNPYAVKGLGHVIGLAIVRRLEAEPQLLSGVTTLGLEFLRDLALFPDPTRVDR
jgi:hypothetical protein